MGVDLQIDLHYEFHNHLKNFHLLLKLALSKIHNYLLKMLHIIDKNLHLAETVPEKLHIHHFVLSTKKEQRNFLMIYLVKNLLYLTKLYRHLNVLFLNRKNLRMYRKKIKQSVQFLLQKFLGQLMFDFELK